MTGTSIPTTDPRRRRMEIVQRRLSRRGLIRAGAGAGLAAGAVGTGSWHRSASALAQDAAAPAGKIVISLAAEPSTLE